jgi:methyl-accepting chemotaxis protein
LEFDCHMARIVFRDLSIKHKLVIVTSALLLLVSISIVIFFPKRQEAQAGKFQSQKAWAIARIVANSSEAGLNFGDASAVKETLRGLREIGDVQFAVILDNAGGTFAAYNGAKAAQFLPSVRDIASNKIGAIPSGKGIKHDKNSGIGTATTHFIESDTHLIAVAPVLSNGKPLGSVILGIDQKGLREEVAGSRIWALAAGILIVGVGSSLFVLLASRIVKPLKQLENAANRIVRGDVNFNIDIHQGDEIGVLAESFRELVRYFQNVAAAAEALSQGELDANVTSESNQDVISRNFIALRAMIEETRWLIQQAKEGHLSARGDGAKFQGVYRDLVEAINQMMDVIVLPVREASESLEGVALRDLRVRMRGDYQGDYAKLKEAINTAITNLDDGLKQVADHSSKVADGSSQIYCSSQMFAAGASEQTDTLNSVSGQLDEMTRAIHQNVACAQQGRELADVARSSSDKGVESMQEMSRAIDKIKASSDATAKIIKTIDDIAFQTNLLALNAAVEAARAGESGRGFAIVAEEVRNLAKRSAEAARNTAAMIEQSVKNAESGVKINQKVMKDLEEITSQVNLVGSVMVEIAASSEHQQKSVENVMNAVSQLTKMTQQYVSNSAQSAVAAEALSGQADAMQDLVTTFQLSSDRAPNDGEKQLPTIPIQIDQKQLDEAIQWDA